MQTKSTGNKDDLKHVLNPKPQSPYTREERDRALKFISNCSLQVNTQNIEDSNSRPEYEHLYPIQRRVEKSYWEIPKGNVVFEPANYASPRRYRYRPDTFQPVEFIAREDGPAKPYSWRLTPDSG